MILMVGEVLLRRMLVSSIVVGRFGNGMISAKVRVSNTKSQTASRISFEMFKTQKAKKHTRTWPPKKKKQKKDVIQTSTCHQERPRMGFQRCRCQAPIGCNLASSTLRKGCGARSGFRQIAYESCVWASWKVSKLGFGWTWEGFKMVCLTQVPCFAEFLMILMGLWQPSAAFGSSWQL